MDCSNFNNQDDAATAEDPSWTELNWVNEGFKGKGKDKGNGKGGFKDNATTAGNVGHRCWTCVARRPVPIVS